jgi:predicted GIY-YIG superfamily endonuclease
MWYVYILKMSDGEYYVGSTNNLKRRIDEHIKGRAIPTKWRLPLILEAYVAVKSETTARSLEKYLKSGSGFAFMKKRLLPLVKSVEKAAASFEVNRPLRSLAKIAHTNRGREP